VRFFAGVGRSDGEAIAEANAAVDLFFHPAADPGSVDLALFRSCARRNLVFGTAASVIPRGRVGVAERWRSPEDGAAASLARITEGELLLSIAEAEMPEETGRSLRERLSGRMGEYVEAWKRVRGN
jgi:hypothetical protein